MTKTPEELSIVELQSLLFEHIEQREKLTDSMTKLGALLDRKRKEALINQNACLTNQDKIQ